VARLEQDAGPLTLKVERGRQTASGDQDSHRYVLTLIGDSGWLPRPGILMPALHGCFFFRGMPERFHPTEPSARR
jgi:hypothetical protein